LGENELADARSALAVVGILEAAELSARDREGKTRFILVVD
jgi:hypothetical protein